MQRVFAKADGSDFVDSRKSDLLFMLGEELKRPLSTIKMLAEKHENTQTAYEAAKALRTIDNVLLYQRLDNDQTNLDLGPVHVGGVLSSLMNEMRVISLMLGHSVGINIQRGINTVDSDNEALRAGLQSLWQAVVAISPRDKSTLTWYVARNKIGIRICLVNDNLELIDINLNSSKSNAYSNQPIKGVSGPATDLITAQGMFRLLGGKLSKSRKNGHSGFGVTLPASQQMSLV